MKKRIIATMLSVIVLMFFMSVTEARCYAATTSGTTVYGGVDYASVYNYDYYINKYPDIKQAYGENDSGVLSHFVNCGMAEGRQGSASFDVTSYRLEYADLRQAFGSNLKSYYMHYIYCGKNEGRLATGVTQLVGATTRYNGVDYSTVYNFDYYINKYPDIKKAYGNDDVGVLNHFINCGMTEGRQGSAAFDVSSYRLAYSDLRQAFGSDLRSYYLHYINTGKKEGRIATGVYQLIGGTTKYNGVDYSAVYNYDYYVNRYPDIKKAYGDNDAGVLSHFVNCGMAEGRQGSAAFDVTSYRLANYDLRQAYGSDLKSYYVHYMYAGKREGRTATGVTQAIGRTTYGGVDYSSIYNYSYYVNRYPDIKKAFGDDDAATISHFVNCGMTEGRQGSDNFNITYYKGNYADLRQAFGSDLRSYYLHFLNIGKSEGRNAKSINPVGWYAENGNKYFYQNGSPCTGWKTIDGRNYYFSSSGVLSSSSGVDVSAHRGYIDWQAVKNSGIDFAIIRVGYGNDQQDQDDAYASRNISECERLGIPYGVYLYSYALSDDDARSEASHILRMLNGKHPPLGIYYDVEDTAYYNNHNFDPVVNKVAINNFCKIVMTAMFNSGNKAGIYSNYNYLNNVIDMSCFANNGLWLAYWTNSDHPTTDWNIWQYTSSGSVPGISGSVDMDVLINK